MKVTENSDLHFLQGGGSMGTLMREKDWANTSPGPPSCWPAQLKQLTATMLGTPMPMMVCWGTDYIQLYNDAFIPVLGADSKCLGVPISQTYPEKWEMIEPLFAGILNGESFTVQDLPLTVSRNGITEDLHFDFSCSAIRDEFGTARGVLVLCQETTQKVNSLKTLSESKERFRAMAEGTDLLIAESDETRKITFINQPWVQFSGKSREELLDLDWTRLIHPEEKETVIKSYRDSFARKRPHKDRFRMLDRNGEYRWLYVQGSPRFLKDGSFAGFITSSVDITDQVGMLNQLEKSENRFRTLIEEAPVATCFFSGRELRIDIVNQKMLDLWGKGDVVMGKTLAEALPELEDQPFPSILDSIFDTGKPYEAKGMRSALVVNGIMGIYYFDFTYKPLINAAGEVYGILNMATDVTQQVLAQQQIEETQKELITLFDQSPVGVAILKGEEFVFRIANKFYGDLVGRRTEDLIGKTLLQALPELAGQGFDKLLENVLSTGVPYTAHRVPVVLNRKNNLETIYVDLTYQPLTGEKNTIGNILVVCTDVTSQVLSQMEIELSENKLRSIIASAPAGIGLFVGRDLIIENPNQTFIDIVGKGSDISGKPLREVMQELLTEGQPFLQILDDVFTSGIEFQSPGSLVKIFRNGVMTNNYYNITYTPVFNAEGEVYAILDIAVDVTEQIKAQQALEAAEIELRGAIELAGLATWTMDITGEKFIYSPRFMEWLGFSEDTKGLDEAYNPLPEGFRQSVPAALEATFMPDSPGFYDNEHPIVNRLTGQTRIIHAQGQVFYDETGAPSMLRGTAQDITLERELQIALETEVKLRTRELNDANLDLIKSNAELAQFAYIASHDLQEPLRKISTFSQMLEKSIGADISPQSQNFLNKIKSSSARVTTLINDVLKYSQLVKENEVFEKTSLDDVLRNNISDFDLLIEQKRASVRFDKLPVIEAIPLQMSQLFGNLLGNALKFSRKDADPVISITCSPATEKDVLQHRLPLHQTYLKIIFADNGIGLDPEYLEKIFHIFQRLHRKSDYEGTGIGLAMCKKIALNHHGDISADSKGQGAVFTIILPVQQHREPVLSEIIPE